MHSFLSRIKISRIFILSLTFLTFVIFFISTIFSTFIYNNSKQQLIESLYIQAKSINALIPQINEINGKDLNNLVNGIDLKGNNEDRLRVTIIDENWVVVADSFLTIQELKPPFSNYILYTLKNPYKSKTIKKSIARINDTIKNKIQQ